MKKLTLVLAIVLAAAPLVGCKHKLKTDSLEGVIKTQLKKNGLDGSVTCPKDVEAKAGGTFDCSGKANDKAIVVSVTQKDDKGNVTIVLKTIDGKTPGEYAAAAAADTAHPEAAAAAASAAAPSEGAAEEE